MSDSFHDIEQPSGAPIIPSAVPPRVDHYRRQVYESYESFLRRQIAEIANKRGSQWQRDYTNIDCYLDSVAAMRERLRGALGFWSEPETRPAPLATAGEPLVETADFRARRFMLDVCDGLQTYAIELIPKSAGPHPGLVVQHGYSGTPELACGFAQTANRIDFSHRSLGLRAVRRGYHVVAVHHAEGYGTDAEEVDCALPGHPKQSVHYGKNRLHRLALLGGGTLMGLDVLTSSRGVDWLCHQPGVDARRIGMYGFSRGGESALMLAAVDTRIRAMVCSAFFNQRLQKLIGPYPRGANLDWFHEGAMMPFLVSHFSDSDLVSLIVPRSLAVESGQYDVTVDLTFARQEFELAHTHYARLGLTDRVEFIAHADGHISATARAFDFLARELA